MPTLRHHLRRLSWIALLAILSLALAPTISHALASSAAGGSAWAEICTPQGTRLVALDDGQPPAPALSFGHLDHCPLCGLSGTALGLPPAAPSVE
ncbi:MAG TPA: DUF2946 family protein, partial [Ideonella sp.]|nr:DUF2946 family protein [Ideonella sp.]